MAKLLNRKTINPLKPLFTGEKRSEEISLQEFRYDEDSFAEDKAVHFKDVKQIPEGKTRHWINIHGIHEPEKIQKICATLGIHSLTIQDILDVNQRPKVQEFEGY